MFILIVYLNSKIDYFYAMLNILASDQIFILNYALKLNEIYI